MLCTLLVLVKIEDVRILVLVDATVVFVPKVTNVGVDDELLLEGDVIVEIGILLVYSDGELVTASVGVLDMVSDVVLYARGVEETSFCHVVVDVVTVLGRDVDRRDACDTSIVVVTFSIVLLFTDEDLEIPDVDVVIGVKVLLVDLGE